MYSKFEQSINLLVEVIFADTESQVRCGDVVKAPFEAKPIDAPDSSQ